MPSYARGTGAPPSSWWPAPGSPSSVTTALKPLVGRDINQGFLAFPSGHTASMTAVTLVIMLVVIQRRGIRAVLACCCSRP